MKKISLLLALSGITSGALLTGCNGGGTSSLGSAKPVVNSSAAKSLKAAMAGGSELSKFYAESGYKIDFADSILVGPQYYAYAASSDSKVRQNVQYDWKILKISDNSLEDISKGSVTCGSSYDGCKLNINKDKLPSGQYALELSQDGHIVAGSLFYVSSASISTNLVLDAVTTGGFIKKAYLIPQLQNGSDTIDEELIKSAFDKAAKSGGYAKPYDLDEAIYLYHNNLTKNGKATSSIITEMVTGVKQNTLVMDYNLRVREYRDLIEKILELNQQAQFAISAEKLKKIIKQINEHPASEVVLDTLIGFVSQGAITDGGKKTLDALGKLPALLDFLSEANGSANALNMLNTLIANLKQTQAEALEPQVEANKYLQSMDAQLKRKEAKEEIRNLQGSMQLIEMKGNVLRNALQGQSLEGYIYTSTAVSPAIGFEQLLLIYNNNAAGDGIFNKNNLEQIQKEVNNIIVNKAVGNLDEFLNAVDSMYKERAQDGINVIPLRRAHNAILSDYQLGLINALSTAELIQKNALFLGYKYPYYKEKVTSTENILGCDSGSAETQYNCKISDISAKYNQYRDYINNKFKSHYISAYKDIYGADRLIEPAGPLSKNLSCNLLSLTYEGITSSGKQMVKNIGASCLNGKGEQVVSTLDVNARNCDYKDADMAALVNINGALHCKDSAKLTDSWTGRSNLYLGGVDEHSVKETVGEHRYTFFNHVTYFSLFNQGFEQSDIPVNFLVPKNSDARANHFFMGFSLPGMDDKESGITQTDFYYTPKKPVDFTDNRILDAYLTGLDAFKINSVKRGEHDSWTKRNDGDSLFVKYFYDRYENKTMIPAVVELDGAYYPFNLEMTSLGTIGNVKGKKHEGLYDIYGRLGCDIDNCNYSKDKSELIYTDKEKNVVIRLDHCGKEAMPLAMVYDGKSGARSNNWLSGTPYLGDVAKTSGNVCIYAKIVKK